MTTISNLFTSFTKFKLEEIEQSIPDRFQQQVDRYPEKVAIKTSSYKLTYDALNRAANRVAQAIITHCSQEKEVPVGLFFGHNENMIVAMLGALKAGKISILVDSTQPPDRLRHLFEDSEASLIITSTQNFLRAKELRPTAQLLNIDELDANFPDQNINLSISPDDLACIIYTSGSTGKPKGTVYNHRCLLHLVKRYTNTLCIQPDDRMLLISSSSHVAGMNTIFRALLNGATVLPFNVNESGPVHLTDWLKKEKITLYNSVPTIFRKFVSALSNIDTFPDLRIILLGGELVTKRDVDLFKKHFSPNCLLINNVGCTELSGYRQYIVDQQTKVQSNILPVGYAVEGVEAILLDESGKEVGFNCIGEITLKSRYLALGYWRKPTLTAEKFLPSLDGGEERIFRTGDLGYMHPDGCLMHLGRKDDSQLKIKGYKVEIAEVEILLLEHSQVKEAAVVVKDIESDNKELIAFVVPHQTNPEDFNTVVLNQNDLESFLSLNLPDYMVPSTIVFLDAIPLHPSGKVNRHALTLLAQTKQPQASISIGSID
jgi:amino acid adenylation domain-containing protein